MKFSYITRSKPTDTYARSYRVLKELDSVAHSSKLRLVIDNRLFLCQNLVLFD